MTCIVGLIHNGSVYMDADSGSLTGYAQTSVAETKVYRKGELLIGDSGSVRCAQILRYAVKPQTIPQDADMHEYLSTVFADDFRRALKAAGIETPWKQPDPWGEALIGARGRLYKLGHDFSVVSSAGSAYMCLGGAADIALGAMFVTRAWPDPKLRLELALSAATHHMAGILPPYVIEELKPEDWKPTGAAS